MGRFGFRREGCEFVKLINDCFLTQHVRNPTRENNILDLVLTTEADMVDDVFVDSPLSNSDHNILSWIFKCSTIIEEKLVKDFSYNKGNYMKIGEHLSEIDWKEEFNSNLLVRSGQFFIPN